MDLDLDPEEGMPLSPGYSKIGDKTDAETLTHYGKKEEINYDWTQGMFADYKPGLENSSNKLQIFMGILEVTSTPLLGVQLQLLLLQESVRCNDRILLFSQSLFTLNLIEDFLKRKHLTETEVLRSSSIIVCIHLCSIQDPWVVGVNYFRLDGSTSALEREKLINTFNANTKVKLFLVSTRAGSLGVNLVGANRVIIFDASWNPCHDTQAVCRVYRSVQISIIQHYNIFNSQVSNNNVFSCNRNIKRNIIR